MHDGCRHLPDLFSLLELVQRRKESAWLVVLELLAGMWLGAEYTHLLFGFNISEALFRSMTLLKMVLKYQNNIEKASPINFLPSTSKLKLMRLAWRAGLLYKKHVA